MGITAVSGPFVAFGITQTSSGAVGDYNEERGPSLYDLGLGVLDPRSYFNYKPGAPVGTRLYGFPDKGPLVDCQPFTANSSAIAGSTTNVPVAGTALTLAPLSSFGAIQTTIIAPETGLAVSVIALDSTAATLNFGSGGTIAIWNPAAVPGRALSIINSSNGNTEAYIVNGRDAYGIKMTETILASTTSTGTGVGKKAFKYIASITPSTGGTISATAVRIGFVDVFGFPLRTDYFANTQVLVSSAPMAPTLMVLSSANAVLASTVPTATSTTPDARGTFNSTLATAGTTTTRNDGTAVRLTINQPITATMASNVTATDQTSMFGIAQYSNF